MLVSGDDSEHSDIPYYELPGYWESRAGFPEDGSDPESVDVIFFDLYVAFPPVPFDLVTEGAKYSL